MVARRIVTDMLRSYGAALKETTIASAMFFSSRGE
jgi:hypothetical protein